MTTNHPISIRILSLFTIIILLFGLVGCNSNVNNGQNGGESTNNEVNNTTPPENNENSVNAPSYQWWEESSTLFSCDDENGTRNLHVFVANTTDGISIAFSCSGDGYDWSMFTTHNTEVEYLEKNGEKLYSYTGSIYDVYEDGKVVASGIEPSDNINVIYNATTKTITVTSLLELMNGESPYPVMCSGTYSPS